MEQTEQARERKRLTDTLRVVRDEQGKLEAELGITNGEDRLVNVNDDGSDDAKIEQFVMSVKLSALHQLRLSRKQPYFARMDFTPDPGAPVYGELRPGAPASLYLGRWGVLETPACKLWVADWRSPVANLYYSGQLGRVSYQAPDGEVRGEMSLKRMFRIWEGELLDMRDTGLLDQEAYLTEALSRMTESKLRDVVTTIQAEQNNAIRFDPARPLCVQGAAGSGKTTVALHRVAWILYKYQKEIAPRQLMIIAPNPLFLDYISGVLPDLGVENVRQTTFEWLCRDLLGKHMPALVKSSPLAERLTMAKAKRDVLDRVLRRKGSLALAGELERFLKEWEQRIVPQRDMRLGSAVVITAAEMRRFFLTEFRHFPLQARIDETRKVATIRLDRLLAQAAQLVDRAVEDRLAQLTASLPDGEERRRRAKLLFDSRDKRHRELEERRRRFLAEYDGLWDALDLLRVYGAFLANMQSRDDGYAEVLNRYLDMLTKKQAAPDDLPALLIVAKRLYGLKSMDVRHVVIDEAQDASPLQIKVLRDLFNRDAFTLVGDLCQGVCGDGGLRSWEDVSRDVFGREPALTRLNTAYRSTVEIMEAALAVIARHPVDGVGETRPISRHGEKPGLIPVIGEDGRAEAAAKQIAAWHKEGYGGIAVIVKTPEAAQALYQRLKSKEPSIRLTADGAAAFEGGVQVMDAGLVKGLEFDCVLVADAEDRVYPDERFYAKLFYVLCTRALHRLCFLYEGERTKHLEGVARAATAPASASCCRPSIDPDPACSPTPCRNR